MTMETPLCRLPDDMQVFWDKLSPEDKQLSLGDVYRRLEQNVCDLDAIDLTLNMLTGLRNRIEVQFIEERYHPATLLCNGIIDQLGRMIEGIRKRRDEIVEDHFKNQQLQSVLDYKEVVERMAYQP